MFARGVHPVSQSFHSVTPAPEPGSRFFPAAVHQAAGPRITSGATIQEDHRG